jgi:hypothetical protein
MFNLHPVTTNSVFDARQIPVVLVTNPVVLVTNSVVLVTIPIVLVMGKVLPDMFLSERLNFPRHYHYFRVPYSSYICLY